MKTKNYIAILGLLLFISTHAIYAYEPPAINFSETAGSTYFDIGVASTITSTGNYVVVGNTYGNDGDVSGFHGGAFDGWVVMFSPSGDILWQRTLGGTGDDNLTEVNEMIDGNLIITGYTSSTDGDVTFNHGYFDYWAIKLNMSGDIIWQKCYGGTSREYSIGSAITSDGGFIMNGHGLSFDGDVTGNHGWDYWVVKADIDGNIQWQKCYGGSDLDYGTVVNQTSDGGYILGGQAYSSDGDKTGYYGLQDYWIVKINSVGDLEWQNSFGGSDEDYCRDVIQTSDGSYIATGVVYSDDGMIIDSHGGSECWVVKINPDGSPSWEKVYGSSGSDLGENILEANSGGFILLNASYGNDGDVSGQLGYGDAWLVKINFAGDIDWQKCFGGSNADGGTDIQLMEDGGFLIGGTSSSSDGDVPENLGVSDFWIFRTTAELCDVPPIAGTEDITSTSALLHWDHVWGGAKYRLFWREEGAVTWNKKTTTADHLTLNGLNCNTNYEWKVRTGCTEVNASVFSETISFSTLPCREIENNMLTPFVFPNPASDYLMIANLSVGDLIAIRDLSGKLILSQTAENENTRMDISGLASGLYILEISGINNFTKTIIKEK